MVGSSSITDQRIIDSLRMNYGIEVSALTCIPLGADMDASVYKVLASDQSSYFVKLKRGHNHGTGSIIQRMLYESGIPAIIPPVMTQKGQSICSVDDCTLIVYPFIKGHDGFSHDLTKDQWITLGGALRKVHEFRLPASMRNQIARECYSCRWQDAVRSVYHHIDADCIVTDQIALKLLSFMKQHKELIVRLVQRAEELGKKIQQQSYDFVVCHSDIHAGNVLIANADSFYNGALFIVDWDQPIMAPKERDLMFIGGGIANVWNNLEEEEFFYKGYGKTTINKEILAYYRYERIVQDIAEYGHALLLTVDGGKDREVMYQHFMDMFEPRGVVEIAFNTDTDL